MTGDQAPETRWEQVARAKLSHVLGREQGAAVMVRVMEQHHLPTLATAEDLYQFAQHVSRLDGFASAVGALLSLHAVMNGASGTRR
jgi:hypothetical protein